MKSRKILIILTLTLAVIALAACRDTLPSDYRESAFFAEIRYEYAGDTFYAEVNVGPPSDTQGLRDIEIRFTSPKRLEGLCASRKNGISSVTLGSAEIKNEASAKGFLHAASLLIPSGEIKILEKFTENGLVFYRAESYTNGKTVSLMLDSDGAPNRISYEDTTLTVIRFSSKS